MDATRSETLRRPAAMQVLELCLTEARPQVQLAFLLRFACGAVLATPTGTALPVVRVALGLLVWELTVVAVYLFNGAADVDGDRVNRSARPIAGGTLTAARAGGLAALFAVAAVLGAFLLGPAFTVATIASLALGYMYSARPFDLRKRRAGAGLTAMAGGLLTYSAGAYAVQGQLTAGAVVVAVAMSLWMGIVGATAKDFTDQAGDIATGRNTLLTQLGVQTAARVVATGAPMIGVAFAAAAALVDPILLLPGVAVLAGGVIVSWRTRHIAVATRRAVLARPYRAFMATQLLAHLSILATALATPG